MAAKNDYTTIKPVDGLGTIGGLKPAKRRDERKRRHSELDQQSTEAEQQSNEDIDQNGHAAHRHSIDYRA